MVVLWTTKRRSHSFAPSFADQQLMVSYLESARPEAQTRPSKTAGVDLPTCGIRNTTFSRVVGFQVPTRPVSDVVPLPFGPRHWGQSAATPAAAKQAREIDSAVRLSLMVIFAFCWEVDTTMPAESLPKSGRSDIRPGREGVGRGGDTGPDP